MQYHAVFIGPGSWPYYCLRPVAYSHPKQVGGLSRSPPNSTHDQPITTNIFLCRIRAFRKSRRRPRRHFLPSSGIEQVTLVPLLIPFTSSDAPIRLAR